MTLRTSYMHIVPDSGIAQTDQPVLMEDANATVQAASMFANNKLQTISLSTVRATYVKKTR